MDDRIRKLNIKIRNKETEIIEVFTKIQKLEKEIAKLHHKKISCKKIGNSRNVTNRSPRSDLCS